MKIRIDVDCTPEEARAFLGLPDLSPLHDALVQQMRDRMSASMQAIDADAMLKAWQEQLMKMWSMAIPGRQD